MQNAIGKIRATDLLGLEPDGLDRRKRPLHDDHGEKRRDGNPEGDEDRETEDKLPEPRLKIPVAHRNPHCEGTCRPRRKRLEPFPESIKGSREFLAGEERLSVGTADVGKGGRPRSRSLATGIKALRP
jgi:hypothetical protein